MSKLDPEIKAQWINALRSGDYDQGQGRLRKPGSDIHDELSDDKFCCLGVLCDLQEKAGKGYWKLGGAGKYSFVYSPTETRRSEASDFLPYHLAKDLGIDENGKLYDNHANRLPFDLSELNDTAALDDNQVADLKEIFGEGLITKRTKSSGWNDEETVTDYRIGANFDQIADLIERYL